MFNYDGYCFDIETPNDDLTSLFFENSKETILIYLSNIEFLQRQKKYFPELTPSHLLFLGSLQLNDGEFDFYVPWNTDDSSQIISDGGNYRISYDMDLDDPSYHLLMRQYICGLLTNYDKQEIGSAYISQFSTSYRSHSSLH